MRKQTFLDYASSTPVNDEVYNTYIKLVKDCYINSEAVYSSGVEVNKLVETSRKQIAKLLNVESDEVIFTSGASEANSFAIKGFALKNMHKGKHIISSKMEHSSVLNSLRQLEEIFGFSVTYLPVYQDGKIAVEDLEAAMRDDTILVSMMAVNNEIGSIQDISKIARIVHKNSKTKLHVDAVQAISKVELNLEEIDMLSLTAHKLYGIKGCGVLIRKKNIELLPLIAGGQQEYALRGGTLNAPACIVFAKTLRLALKTQKEHDAYVMKLNQKMRKNLQEINNVVINSPLDGSPYILNFSCLSMGSEIMMNALNAYHICVSTQSTCSARTTSPSHTLVAMGFEDKITHGAIRVSFSHLTTMQEVEYFIEKFREIINEYKTR